MSFVSSAAFGLAGLTRSPTALMSGTSWRNEPSHFRSQHVAEKGYARDIAAGSIEGGDETCLDRVSANREDDRNDRGLPCFGLWTIAQTALGVILGSYLCVAGSTPPEETIVWQLVYISVGPFIVAVLVVVVVSGWEAL